VDTPKPRRPSCPALICCEHVEMDEAKGRIDIHNIINAILLETIPGDTRFAVHFSLTEGQGDYDLELVLVLEHQHGEGSDLHQKRRRLVKPVGCFAWLKMIIAFF